MKKEFVIEIICFLFIVLFVYAAVSKLIDVEKFRVQIGQSPLLTNIAGFVSWFVPVSEIIVSIMLTTKRFRLVGLLASFTLMLMFTFYIVAILQFSDHIPCSCGGVLQDMGWTEHLYFNVTFVLMALIAMILQSRAQGKNQQQILSDYQSETIARQKS